MKSILEAKSVNDVDEWCDEIFCKESCIFSNKSKSPYRDYCYETIRNMKGSFIEEKVEAIFQKIISINRKEKLEKLLS